MFGLLSNLTDEQRQALFAAGAQMMAARGNTGQAIGQGLMGGLQAYQQAGLMKDRRAQEAQERAFLQRRMDEYDQQQADRAGMRQAFQGAFTNPNLVQNDDMGNPIPQAPGQFDPKRFLSAAAPYMDPMQAFAQLSPKPRGPVALGEGGRLVDPDTGREIASNPKPVKPLFQPGQTRELKSGRMIYTQEYDGKEWKTISKSSMDAPDKPDKGVRPQLYDGPDGPVWVTPPQPGQSNSTLPVTDPFGNPISAKKRNTPLTESQAKGTLFLGQMRAAEDAVKKLEAGGFKADVPGNQADVAIAVRAKEAGMIPGALMNLYAGKNAQKYSQAQEQWSEAFLRIKTGAASTRDEVLRNARTFFPQPGDSPETVQQKAEMRAVANKQMEIIAGQGVQQLDSQDRPSQPNKVRRYNPQTGRIE